MWYQSYSSSLLLVLWNDDISSFDQSILDNISDAFKFITGNLFLNRSLMLLLSLDKPRLSFDPA